MCKKCLLTSGLSAVWAAIALLISAAGAAWSQPPAIFPQTGHSRPITDLLFVYGGDHLLSVGNDNRAVVWDLFSRRQVVSAPLDALAVRLAASPEGDLIAVQNLRDPAITLWNARTLKPLRPLPLPADPPDAKEGPVRGSQVHWMPGNARIIARSYGLQSIRFQSVDDGKEVRNPIELRMFLTSFSVSADGTEIAVVGRGRVGTNPPGVVSIHAAADGASRRVWVAPGKSLLDAVYIGPSRLLTVSVETNDATPSLPGGQASSLRSTLDLWNTANGSPIKSISVDSVAGRVVRIVDGFVTIDADGGLRRYDSSLNLQKKIPGASGGISALAVSPSGDIVATVGADGVPRLWSLPNLDPLGEIRAYAAPLTAMSVAGADGGRIITADESSRVTLWSLEHAAAVTVLPPDDRTTAVTISASGSHVARARSDGVIEVWSLSGVDRDSGRLPQCVALLQGHRLPATRLALTPDGRRLASQTATAYSALLSARDEEAFLWDVGEQRQLASFPAKTGDSLTFRANGATLAVGNSTSGSVTLFDSTNGQQTGAILRSGELSLPVFGGNLVAFSPDGRRVALAQRRGLTVWDVASGAVLWHDDVRFSWDAPFVVFSADGETLITGSGSHSVRLLEARTGRSRGAAFSGHDDAVAAAAFLSPGVLVSAGADGRAFLWDVATGREVAQLLTGKGSDRVILLPDLCYATERSIVDAVAFRVGERAYPFDSFDLVYNRPDLVLHALARLLPPGSEAFQRAQRRVTMYYEAVLARCQRNGLPAPPRNGPATLPPAPPRVETVTVGALR